MTEGLGEQVPCDKPLVVGGENPLALEKKLTNSEAGGLVNLVKQLGATALNLRHVGSQRILLDTNRGLASIEIIFAPTHGEQWASQWQGGIASLA